jgi:hypothetical protein
MKNLTGVLVFSLSLLLASGCRKSTGENPDPVDATRMDSGTSEPATGKAEGALKGSDGGATKEALGGKESTEACVDRWLKEHKLDQYGHPEGTMYAGGTPLFNEATGESRDRLEYVFEQQPEAKKACASSGTTGK